MAYCSGLIGYAGWGGLLSRYPADKITPLTLPVPVIALLVARIFLDERMNVWHWAGMALVMFALLLQVFGGKRGKCGRTAGDAFQYTTRTVSPNDASLNEMSAQRCLKLFRQPFF